MPPGHSLSRCTCLLQVVCLLLVSFPQVLMQTRSASSRTRCLALEVVAHMLDRLREEYLVLLPEVNRDGFDISLLGMGICDRG
jgi:hypothetical protein